MTDTFWGLLIPFLGTSLGAACVFFMRGEMNRGVQRGLTGFAAGVMVAASIWSLLVPALDECEPMGRWAFLPPVIGFGIGMVFLLLLDHVIPHLHMNASEAEGPKSHLVRTTMLVLAVTLHNIPEGMLSAWCMRDSYPGMRASRQRRPWRFHWESRSRISRKVRSFPCRSSPREWGAGNLLRAACSRA